LTTPAGAGKTTAVAAAVRTLTRPAAWLTLDWTDAAPGRLVRYLEAALAAQLPGVRPRRG
jgi:ATP/maltotriose-dependent transcriptional regulator MalT